LDLLNRSGEAEQAYIEALNMEPGYTKAWLNLASARFNARHYSSAAQAFRRGLALRPDEAEAWIRLAHCEWLMNQKMAAVATLQIGLRYRPLVTEHWLDLGLWLVEVGHLSEARDVHTRLIDMDPEVAARLQASLNRAQTVRTPTAIIKPSRKPVKRN
jgi:tetratricopeptide (TPR) repeat protein